MALWTYCVFQTIKGLIRGMSQPDQLSILQTLVCLPTHERIATLVALKCHFYNFVEEIYFHALAECDMPNFQVYEILRPV